MEEWKEVAGTNGKIEVSNEGRVRSLLRGKPYILKTQVDNKGYRRLRVTIDRQKMSFKLHRIVAQAFIDNPNNLPQVNHIDGNKDNNRASNLEWVTNQQNVIHSYAVRNGEINVSVHDMEYTPIRMTMPDGKKKYIKGRNYSNDNCLNSSNKNRSKKVIGTLNNVSMTFESVADAERYIGSRHITDVLKGKRQQAKGWTFVYAERG